MNTKQKGFNLIELMVVIAIIGILAVTGWRTYDQYQTRVTRSDGIDGLARAANDMEKCGSKQGNIYTNCVLTANQSPNGNYNLALPAALNPDATGFVITASRVIPNIHDTNCLSGGVNYDLVINNLGQTGIRLGNDAPVFGNTAQIRKCWNK